MWANTWGSMCVCISHIHTKKMYIHECEHTSLFWSNCMYDRVIPISCKTSFLHRSCKLQSLKVTINYYFFFLILKKKNFNCVVLLLVWFFFFFFFWQTDFQHKFTVQASPTMDKRKSLISSCSSPPASPTIIPRLRAIQCKELNVVLNLGNVQSVCVVRCQDSISRTGL